MPTPTTTPLEPPQPGLLNNPPAATPGSSGGQPVATYNPATAVAKTADSAGYTAKPFEVAPNQTVQSQLKEIITAGSPLLEAARANALQTMNRRGLLNSSQAVGAGHKAVIETAMPIATADAATYDRAATNTTSALNREAEFTAGASNAASLANAQLDTQNAQFNAGQRNASFSQAATAANALTQTAMQIKGSLDAATIQADAQKFVAQLNADTTLSATDKQTASAEVIAQINANTNLSVADKQAAVQKFLGELQSQTQLGVQGMQSATQQAVAQLQTNASLTIEQQKIEAQQLIASMGNSTTLAQQNLINDGALANIMAKGGIDSGITQVIEANKNLLQSNVSASNLYTQTMQTIANIQNSPNLDVGAKAVAMNNAMQALNDGLAAIAAISGTPGVQSNIQYLMNDVGGYTPPTVTPGTAINPSQIGNPSGGGGGGGGGAAATPVTTQTATSLYKSILGRAPDSAGMQYYINQGMTAAQLEATLKASPEYQVVSLYNSVLGRPPDAGGRDYYRDALTSGSMTAAQLEANLRASPEYTQPVNAQTVTTLYQTLLGRAPDQGGLDWAVSTGMTGPQLAAFIKTTAEYKARVI